jgi:urease accessory protein
MRARAEFIPDKKVLVILMIVEKILGTIPEVTDLESLSGKTLETVSFEWFEANKKILKKTSSGGTEVGLRLSEPLHDGAIIFENEEKIIYLELLPCELTQAHVHSPRELGRVCFELGNRHLPISIGENTVSTPFDNPTFEYLEKLGFHCHKVTEKFTPEIIVHGHGHSH